MNISTNGQTIIYAKQAKEAALLLQRSTPEQRIQILKGTITSIFLYTLNQISKILLFYYFFLLI